MWCAKARQPQWRHRQQFCPTPGRAPPCAARFHVQEMGCYKVILDCNEDNVTFYEKCGLIKKEIQMVK